MKDKSSIRYDRVIKKWIWCKQKSTIQTVRIDNKGLQQKLVEAMPCAPVCKTI